MNLSCRLAEFPRTAGGGNSDGRQERRRGLVLGCTTTPRVLHSHGMKTGNGVVGTGQAVVGKKGNALASRCAHQGIIVRGSVLVSAAVRAWLVRERTCCRGWQRREGREVLPLWWNATGTRADVAQSRECKKRGHSRGARLSFRCPVPDSFSLGCHGSISSPHTNPQSPHFLALPDPVATAPVFDPADERGVRHRHREDRREQLPPSPTATAPVADSTLFRNRSLK